MFPGGLGTVSPFEINTVNFKETGMISASSVNFEAFMETDIQIIPVLLSDTRVRAIHGCGLRSEV